jgi:hypothetical protein
VTGWHKKPTFVFGGVAQDTMRRIHFGTKATGAGSFSGSHAAQNDGAETFGGLSRIIAPVSGAGVGVGNVTFEIKYDSEPVLPTGPEVQPKHFSTRIWRRVA